MASDEPPPADWGSEAPPWDDEPTPEAAGYAPEFGTASRLKSHPPAEALPVREWPAEPRRAETGSDAPVSMAPASQEAEIVAYQVRERPMREDRGETPAEPRPVERTPEGDFWHALVQDMVAREAVTAVTRELALQSQLVARAEGQWTLRVENESLTQASTRERLQNALADAGHAVRVVLNVGTVSDSPSRRNAIVANSRQKAAQELLLADPFVQEMMREFGAKIVPGSVKPL